MTGRRKFKAVRSVLLVLAIMALAFNAIGCDQTQGERQDTSRENSKVTPKSILQKMPNESPKFDVVGNRPYWQKAKQGTLIIALSSDSPPFCKGETMEKSEGFSRVLADIICKKLGLEGKTQYHIFPKDVSPNQQMEQLINGEVDIILTPLTRTASRGIRVAFTKPYCHVTQGVLLRQGYRHIPKNHAAMPEFTGKEVKNFFHLRRFKDLKVAVADGSANKRLCEKMLPDASIEGYASKELAAKAVVDGKCTAMVADATYVNVWMATHPNNGLKVTAVTGVSTQEGIGIVMRKDDPDFLRWLDLLLDELEGDGTLDVLKQKYIEDMSWLKE